MMTEQDERDYRAIQYLMSIVCIEDGCHERATRIEVVWMSGHPWIVGSWCREHRPLRPLHSDGEFYIVALPNTPVGHA